MRPPTPENASLSAERIVGSTVRILGKQLDYSIESLKTVDEILEGFRNDGTTVDECELTLFDFGCYVGEVFVRHAAGRWRHTAETSMADSAGFPLVIQLGKNTFCNPIGKVYKRMAYGDEHYLPYFYEVFTKDP
ncbi:MAG: hypothetical protein ACRCZF_11435 [Gemmataceae bacterium]